MSLRDLANWKILRWEDNDMSNNLPVETNNGIMSKIKNFFET